MGEYAGESIAKKVCRVRLYRRARALFRTIGREGRELRCFFLIGPDAAEIGCLKHIFNALPENCVGLDSDASCVARLRDRWPRAHAIHGELRDAQSISKVLTALHPDDVAPEHLHARSALLSDARRFDFVHLDLMGTLSRNTLAIYSTYSNLATFGTIAAMTFLRAREIGLAKEWLDEVRPRAEALANLRGPGVNLFGRVLRRVSEADPARSAQHMTALAKAYTFSKMKEAVLHAMVSETSDRSSLDTGKGRIWALPGESGVRAYKRYAEEAEKKASALLSSSTGADLVAIAEGIGSWFSVASFAYRGDVSPMGVVAAQLVNVHPRFGSLEDTMWAREVKHLSRDSSSVIKKDSILDLLAEADSLEKEFTKQQVAEILNVEPGTLASWRAHRTMGTYA